MEQPNAEASIDIAAPPERVYELVSNVEELPRWAAEIDRCQWRGGASGPAVGARFRGTNKLGWRRWSTTCTVTAADAPERFAFRVKVAGVPSAKWEYSIEPTDEGCRVTERAQRLLPKPVGAAVNRLVLGIRDRDAHNQANIEATLASLKQYAEQRAT